MSKQIGRNDPCPCRSGRKYKYCHLGRTVPISPVRGLYSPPELARRSLLERNKILLNGLIDIFGFARGKSWDDVRREISDDQVRKTALLVGGLWHPDTPLLDLLPKPDTRLRALYVGTMEPETIVTNIVRYSLYADQILVVNPFLNPWRLKPEFNPMEHPGKFKADVIKCLGLVLQLAPWIAEEIVVLVPDPGDFDYPLFKETMTLALERGKKNPPTNEELAELEPDAKKQFLRTMYRAPKGFWEARFADGPSVAAGVDLQDMLKYIEKQRKLDRWALDQQDDWGGGQFSIQRSGASLEMGMFLSHATGAFMYTNFTRRWRDILSTAKNDPSASVWSPLTRTFQQLDFKFLDGVDPDFACKIREDGRLDRLRGFLRKTWGAVKGECDSTKSDKLARDFSDELKEEYSHARAEWGKIDVDLLKWTTGSTLVTALAGGRLGVPIPAGGFVIPAVLTLARARMQRRGFEENIPLSVFLDLERRAKPSLVKRTVGWFKNLHRRT